MANKPGRPPKFSDLDALKMAIDSYFAAQSKANKPYTITGLALALGTSRETLLDYEKTYADRTDIENAKEYSDAIKEAKMRCHEWVEDYLFTGKNQVGAIFNLKNNYGWRDKSELEHSGGLQVQVVNYEGGVGSQSDNNTVSIPAAAVSDAVPLDGQTVSDSRLASPKWKIEDGTEQPN